VNDSDGVRLGSVREWEGVGKRTATWGTDRAVSKEEAKRSKPLAKLCLRTVDVLLGRLLGLLSFGLGDLIGRRLLDRLFGDLGFGHVAQGVSRS
jgi:hypothetical protein